VLALHCEAIYMAPGARIGAVLAPDGAEAHITAAKEALAAVAARRKGASPSLLASLPALADARLEMLDVAYADRAGIEATTITDAAGLKQLEERGAKILRKRPLPERPARAHERAGRPARDRPRDVHELRGPRA
jgi:hypothetical protein